LIWLGLRSSCGFSVLLGRYYPVTNCHAAYSFLRGLSSLRLNKNTSNGILSFVFNLAPACSFGSRERVSVSTGMQSLSLWSCRGSCERNPRICGLMSSSCALGFCLTPLPLHPAVSVGAGALGEAHLAVMPGCRKVPVPTSLRWAGGSWVETDPRTRVQERDLWSLLLGGEDGAGPVRDAQWKEGTRGHKWHAGRPRLFSLTQGRKSPMSPAKLDASVQ